MSKEADRYNKLVKEFAELTRPQIETRNNESVSVSDILPAQEQQSARTYDCQSDNRYVHKRVNVANSLPLDAVTRIIYD